MSSNIKIIFVALLSLGLGVLISLILFPRQSQTAHEAVSKDKQILYWVAPMDANYRRDQPGQSPMGMDLVPVYEQESSADEYGPGAIKIAPHVINNLGVRTAKVKAQALEFEIITVGYVQYNQDHIVQVHPRVDGWIEKLFVKASGNRVTKGEPLYTLYSPQLVNAQEELISALKHGNEVLVNGAKERLSALQLSRAFISALERSKKVSQYITFYAPQSGVISSLEIREGFYVQPNTTLMSIAQLDTVWVEADVFERDAALVSVKQSVMMNADYLPNKHYLGEVDYIYPTVNPQTRTLRLRLKFDNPKGLLKPNMFTQVILLWKSKSKALVVPKEAVIRTGTQNKVVLALGEGQFKSIDVELGQSNKQYIEITQGLSVNDSVVTSAQFLLDSESSKSSDFKRMSALQPPNSIWILGVINEVMYDSGMVNITHEPAPQWNWPQMTMFFTVDDSVDINELKKGQSLHFEVSKTEDDDYMLTGVHIMDMPDMPIQNDAVHENHDAKQLNNMQNH